MIHLPHQNAAVSWRSLALGLGGVVLICGLTPYNDYALNNTFLVGNYLPLAVTLIMFLIAVLINAPLSRFAPRWALGSGEMALAMGMMLISCSLPSSGLMRYFPPTLVTPFWLARSSGQTLKLLENLQLPHWLWPTFAGQSPRRWMNDPVVLGYLGRWNGEGSPPYRAWLVPAAAWGVFLGAMYGAVFCLAAIVRRQWFENERLAFPLAQIQMSLVEAPRPGRWFNSILGNPVFWYAFAGVFLLHLWNGLGNYWPRYWPRIPISYNFWSLFSQPPWSYLDYKIKDAAIFFTVLGATYFITSSVAFSLWFFYVLQSVAQMIQGTLTGDPWLRGLNDQHTGAVMAFAASLIWIGRRHWRMVIAHAFGRGKSDDPQARYLAYPLAFWGLVLCAAVMVGWLWAAGAGVGAAIMLVLILLMLFMVIARIIAETGLVHGQLMVGLTRPWTLAASYGWMRPVSLESFYLGATLHTIHYDYREATSVYALHGLKLADNTRFGPHQDTKADRRRGLGILLALFLALIVGYPVSFASTLWTEYHYASSRDRAALTPINTWGARDNPTWQQVGPTLQYEQGNYPLAHSPLGHVGFGMTLTGLLSFLRLRYAWWPLHPIGYLMVGSFPQAHLWFSIFLGWLIKLLIVRFGGAGLFVRAKPFFLGLIVGESLAAGFWMVMGIILSAMNLPYIPVNIMPG